MQKLYVSLNLNSLVSDERSSIGITIYTQSCLGQISRIISGDGGIIPCWCSLSPWRTSASSLLYLSLLHNLLRLIFIWHHLLMLYHMILLLRWVELDLWLWKQAIDTVDLSLLLMRLISLLLRLRYESWRQTVWYNHD